MRCIAEVNRETWNMSCNMLEMETCFREGIDSLSVCVCVVLGSEPRTSTHAR